MIPEYENYKFSWIERHENWLTVCIAAAVVVAMWAVLKIVCGWTGF